MFDGKPKRTELQHTKHTPRTIRILEISPPLSRPALRSTSDLQPIKTTQLLRTPKLQIRRVFHSIRPWNGTASNPYLLASGLRNRPVYHTKHRLSPALPTSEISSVSPYKLLAISRCKSSICSPLSPAFNAFSISFRTCRICNGTFGSNNGLHRHPRVIHFGQAPRRGHGNLRKNDREHRRNIDIE